MTPTNTPNPRRIAAICIIGLISLGAAERARAQGCVPIHGSGIPTVDSAENFSTAGVPEQQWDVSVDYRNFLSDHDYVGTHENARIGTGVFNHANFTDFGLTYNIDARWSVSLTLPFVIEDRSQVSNGLRFHTDSVGIGDTQLEGHFWIIDPKNKPKGNVQLGLGVTTPTGDDHVMGTFLSYNSTIKAYTAVQEPVDQSIQPGTGGWGAILDLYAYHEAGLPGLTAYCSASYTAYPYQDTNGVRTYRSNPYEYYTSIPDSYLYRAGFEYLLLPKQGLVVSFGERMEGVPVQNLIGGSAGFRRPGFSLEHEPGVIWNHKDWTARFYLPFSYYHNREQSLADKEDTILTGKYQHGDAFFANYEWILSLDRRF